MTWTTVGSWLYAGNTSSIALTNQAAGNLLLIEVHNFQNTTVSPVSMSGGGATWSPLGTGFTSAAGFAATHAVFAGTVTATGAQTATVTWSGTAPTTNFLLEGREFHSSVGSWSFDVQGNFAQNATTAWASLTPATAGELYFGSEVNAATAVAGTTSGYVWNVNPFACGAAYNLSCAQGTATSPVWGDTNNRAGIAVLLREGAAAGPLAAPPVQRRSSRGPANRRPRQQAVPFAFTPAAQAGAGLATAAGAALGDDTAASFAVAAAANAGLATGTGTAQQPAPALGAKAGLATGTGTAQQPSVTGTGAPKTATLQDTFPGSALNTTLWATSYGTVAVGGNLLTLTDVASTAGSSGIQSSIQYDLTSSAVYARLASAGAQYSTTQALLSCITDSSNQVAVVVSNGILNATHQAGGTYTTIATAAYNPAAMKWLRLREASGTLFYEYSADGSSWTALTSEADPVTLTAVTVCIQEGQYGGTDPAATSQWSNVSVPGTFPPAVLAAGAGAAQQPSAALSPNAGLAPGTGTAQPPSAAVSASAGLAAGTGTAQGTAIQAAVRAGLAAGAGTAQGAAVAVAVTAGLAAGAGTAQGAAVALAVTAGLAAGAGTAQGAAVTLAVTAGLASGAGTAPASGMARAGLASGTGAAQATAFWYVPAGLASGTGAALAATITTSSAANAPAGLASGASAAQPATAAITVTAGLAAGASAAQAAVAAVAVTAPAGLASGTGAAQAAAAAVTVPAGLAAGTGAAQAATGSTVPAVTALAALAPGGGSAPQATAAAGANAGLAAGTAIAGLVTRAALGVNAGKPGAAGIAPGATVTAVAQANAPAGLATGAGAAQDAAGPRGGVFIDVTADVGPTVSRAQAAVAPVTQDDGAAAAVVRGDGTGAAPGASRAQAAVAAVTGDDGAAAGLVTNERSA